MEETIFNNELVTKINLLDFTLEELRNYIITIGEKPFRAKQIFKWVHQKGVTDFNEMADLSKDLRGALESRCIIKAPEVIFEEHSKDGTRKWVINVGENDQVELVLIPEKGRSTLCISSQVGCAVDCSFCATGKEGFSRNLTLAEIIGQVWLAANSFGTPRSQSDRNITNVVMMGMGEPLLNFIPVVNAMHILMDDNAYGLSKRKVTLSTSGLVPEIYRLSEVSDVSLAISLHAPNDLLRDQLVPINKKYPIADLLEAAKNYIKNCDDKRVTTIEYILINEINDSIEHAEELSKLLVNFPCKINLIPFNSFPKSQYKRPSGNRIRKFQLILQQNNFVVTIRSTRGDDIFAACGQLIGQVNDRTRKKERANDSSRIKTKNI